MNVSYITITTKLGSGGEGEKEEKKGKDQCLLPESNR